MQLEYTQDPLLAPLRQRLSKPKWHNLLLLVLAIQLGRTFITWRLALFVLLPISSASCYRRLARFLSWRGWKNEEWLNRLRSAWVRAVLRCFAPGRGRLVLILDWTLHQDRCRSLWVMLPVGGRAVPLCFWLTRSEFGGKGAQRDFEDEALRSLKQWLPASRQVVLVGDRGFRGADRMRFLRHELKWHYVLRITGETLVGPVGLPGEWLPLRELTPALGGGWEHEQMVCGKTPRKGGRTQHALAFVANLVAVRGPLLVPRPVLTDKGKRTGKVMREATWFLSTSLPLSAGAADVVELYRRRMQIEQTFRDFKALLGMEQEKTKKPWERLQALLWAMSVGFTLDLRAAQPQRTAAPPKRRGAQAPVPTTAAVRRYPRESATRTGLHALLAGLVMPQAAHWPMLRALHEKSGRLQARPQAADRRRAEPALCKRRRTPHVSSPS